MQAYGTFVGENLETDEVDILVPYYGVLVTGVKVSRPAGIEYAFSKNSSFNVEFSDSAVLEIKNNHAKRISASQFNITASEHRLPTRRLDHKPLQALVDMNKGIGETFITEMIKCSEQMMDYFIGIAQGAVDIKNVFSKNKTPPIDAQLKKDLGEGIRIVSNSLHDAYNKATAKAKAKAEAAMTVIADKINLHGNSGVGILTDKNGMVSQGRLTLSDVYARSPMGILGFIGKHPDIHDVLPKGPVILPHVSKLPDILAIISFGVGVMNVINVFREILNYDQWVADEAGFKKVQTDAYDTIKNMNDRVNAELAKNQMNRTGSYRSQMERMLDLTAIIRKDIEAAQARQKAEAEAKQRFIEEQVAARVARDQQRR